jgi:PKD repeat protein
MLLHHYTAAGAYTVSLSVTDSAGHTAAVVTIAAVTVESGMTYVYLPLIKK